MQFETAKYVSANEEADRIRITFNDRYMFVSENDLAIQLPNKGITDFSYRRALQNDENFLYLERDIPTQIQKGSTEEKVQ